MTKSFNKTPEIISPRSGQVSSKLLKKILPLAIFGVLSILILVWVFQTVRKNMAAGAAKTTDGRVTVSGAKSLANINKEYAFPLKDEKGKEVTKIKYLIQTAELRDEIIVKGEKNVPIKGKTFLVVSIKLTNSYSPPVNMNTKDYLRISFNGSKELVAPDIHNDPVEIQAISTKEARLGFLINDSDKNLTFQVGEINGDKDAFPVKL